MSGTAEQEERFKWRANERVDALRKALDALWFVYHHDMGHEGKREDCERSNCVLSRAAIAEARLNGTQRGLGLEAI